MNELLQLHFFQVIMSTAFWVNVSIVLFSTFIIYFVVSKIINVVGKRTKEWSKGHHSAVYFIIVEILNNTKRFLILMAALLFSIHFVDMPDRWNEIISHGWFLVIALQIALWVDSGINVWLSNMMSDPSTLRNPVATVIIGLMLRALIWAMMILSILDNGGVNITALVASLGVGGIAIALAIQAVLSDVFASLSIGFDKPFIIGDFIVFKDIAGTVEHIGLKTTRIRSLSGEQIVCSNAILLQQTIHNYKRMQTRRIVFTFGLAYSTPPAKLRLVGDMLKKIVNEIGDTQFDRAHFLSFDNFRLTFEVVHIVNSADYNKYMDIQQELNIRLMEELERMEIKLAIPTQNILLPEQATVSSHILAGDVVEIQKR